MMSRLAHLLFLLVPLLVAGCNINAPDSLPSPTFEVEALATVSPLPSPTRTELPAVASPTSPAVQLITQEPTATEIPPSPAPSPTATSPFFEYLVQEGETLFYIIQLPQHGYSYEPNVAATVVALNDNIRDADSVIGG